MRRQVGVAGGVLLEGPAAPAATDTSQGLPWCPANPSYHPKYLAGLEEAVQAVGVLVQQRGAAPLPQAQLQGFAVDALGHAVDCDATPHARPILQKVLRCVPRGQGGGGGVQDRAGQG